jgi:acyl transferase domain-containing protein
MTQVHALAPDGRCKSYGAEADGYGRGEGFLVAILEGLQSVADASLVQAVLAGSAVNQDGRSSGLTAPHGPSQAALVTATMQQAGVNHLAYVATHGTGTPLVRQAVCAVAWPSGIHAKCLHHVNARLPFAA